MPWGIAPSWSEAPNRRCKGGTEACAGCSRSDAARCGARGWQKYRHVGVARSEQVWSVMLGSAPSQGCIATSKVRDQHAWPLVSFVLVLAVLSCEEQCSEVQRLLHVVQSCRPCGTCAATNRRPLPSHCYSGRRWRGKRTHSAEMPSEENRGVTRWEGMQGHRTSERCKPDCKMAKSINLTTPYCKVTGRRHRVSPCRSAYVASPCWLLTLDL